MSPSFICGKKSRKSSRGSKESLTKNQREKVCQWIFRIFVNYSGTPLEPTYYEGKLPYTFCPTRNFAFISLKATWQLQYKAWFCLVPRHALYRNLAVLKSRCFFCWIMNDNYWQMKKGQSNSCVMWPKNAKLNSYN